VPVEKPTSARRARYAEIKTHHDINALDTQVGDLIAIIKQLSRRRRVGQRRI